MLPSRPMPAFRRSAAAGAMLLAACGLFEYTPYEVPDPPDGPPADTTPGPAGAGAYWRTEVNLARLAALPRIPSGPWSLAVLADSHQAYDDLARAVEHVNGDPSIVMVLVAGDFTQYGLATEYRWFRDLLSGLEAPFLTVIGNHDALANGAAVYRNMFGPLDYSFTFRGIRFVCANTNIWEFESGVPDWGWLTAQTDAAPDSLRLILVSHIPPWGDQFDARAQARWVEISRRRPVELSIHGHHHNFHFNERYGDGVKYLLADDIGDREYAKVTISDTGVAVQRVRF